MPEYRRWYIPGGTVFLTVVTHDRHPVFSDSANVARLRSAIREVRREWPFDFPGAVVLPDHLHFLWTLPNGDADYSKRVGRMKALYTKSFPVAHPLRSSPNESRFKRNEGSVWQRRFIEHTIRDEEDFKAHLDYIHYNPVRHGYVGRAGDWPWSSFTKWVRHGEYESDWGCAEDRQARMNSIAAVIGE